METRSKIAVIGPFFNASRHVDSWLDGLSAQTYSNFKVYLVDDHSTDDTLERMQARLGGLPVHAEILTLPANSGPSVARNRGIRKALAEGTQIVLLLDSDCRVELVMALVPPIAIANVLLVLVQYARHAPRAWLYLPWICLLKWANAVGVYRGYVSPELCLRKTLVPESRGSGGLATSDALPGRLDQRIEQVQRAAGRAKL
ncbi:MAG: glycosyltransferase family A protein [Pirellulales bacterium]